MSTFYTNRLQAGCVRLREILAHHEAHHNGAGEVRSLDGWLDLEFARPGTVLNGPSTRAILQDVRPEQREYLETEVIRAMVREMRLEKVEGGYRLVPQRGVRG